MKKLKILLGNNTLSLLAGSETWTLTLALALKKLGHDVACFSPELGLIAKELEKNGIHSYNSLDIGKLKKFSYVLEEKVDHDYDVIISNHHHIVEYLRSRYPRKPIISTIHGIIHKMDTKEGEVMAPEHPALTSGVNQFVAVSEEVQEKLQKEYGLDSTIIRNFFDISKFHVKPIKSFDKPKQFFVNTNYNSAHDPEIEVIRSVARHYGAKLTAVGQNFTQTLDLKKALEDSDIVVGMGRSVLEGVAAGRLGIVHGRWGTGGVIHAGSVEQLRSVNFSGRGSEGLATPEQLIAEIDTYFKKETIDFGEQYIRTNHNAVLGAEAYVSLARELTGQAFTASARKRRYADDEVQSGANAGMKKLKIAHE